MGCHCYLNKVPLAVLTLRVVVVVKSLSRVRLFATPWTVLSRVRLFATLGTVAHQAPLSMESSRQEYWGWLPFPPSGDLPLAETEPKFPVAPALANRFCNTEPPGKPHNFF